MGRQCPPSALNQRHGDFLQVSGPSMTLSRELRLDLQKLKQCFTASRGSLHRLVSQTFKVENCHFAALHRAIPIAQFRPSKASSQARCSGLTADFPKVVSQTFKVENCHFSALHRAIPIAQFRPSKASSQAKCSGLTADFSKAMDLVCTSFPGPTLSFVSLGLLTSCCVFVCWNFLAFRVFLGFQGFRGLENLKGKWHCYCTCSSLERLGRLWPLKNCGDLDSCTCNLPTILDAYDCGYPLSRYMCRATRVAADFLDFIAFCRCSSGVAPHTLKTLVSHLPPPPIPGRCRTEIWV